MAGLVEQWRSMSRSRRILAAFIAFWVAFVVAAMYEWLFAGTTDPVALRTLAAQTARDPRSVTAPWIDDVVVPLVSRGPTTGDLIVLVALVFIVVSLGTTIVLAWREARGPRPEPGMGAFDDPLWTSGEVDLRRLDAPG
jgi:hypothetical protein